MSEHFTVFGATGFIGSALVHRLRKLGHHVSEVNRDNWPDSGSKLGHVIYAAGMTSLYAKFPAETVRLQTSLPAQILADFEYTSFLYLSSARLYANAASTTEPSKFEISPTDPDDIYTLTKATAECLCLSQSNERVRVVRLSNVYGAFCKDVVSLASILAEAAKGDEVEFLSSPQSAKDYVHLEEVVRLLPRVVLEGKSRLYNLAKGSNVTNRELANALDALGVTVSFRSNCPTIINKVINIERLTSEFGEVKNNLIDEIPHLLEQTKRRLEQ